MEAIILGTKVLSALDFISVEINFGNGKATMELPIDLACLEKVKTLSFPIAADLEIGQCLQRGKVELCVMHVWIEGGLHYDD